MNKKLYEFRPWFVTLNYQLYQADVTKHLKTKQKSIKG